MNKLKENESLKRDVANFLYAFHLGRSRTICANNLAGKLNVSEVLLRETISELRKEGQPIASSNRKPRGYYIPANLLEAQECFDHMSSRVRKISQALSGLKRGLHARFGSQLDLGLNGYPANVILIDDPHPKKQPNPATIRKHYSKIGGRYGR